MVTAVRPVFQKQGPETNCVIGGEKLGWVSCTAYAMAMGIDSATAGAEAAIGLQGPQADRRHGQGADAQPGRGSRARALRRSRHRQDRAGHDLAGVGPQADPGRPRVRPPGQHRGRCPRGSSPAGRSRPTMRSGSTRSAAATRQGAPEKALVYDPAADGRRPGIIKGETWWAWQDVLSFAAALRLSKTRKLGPGKFYAGFIEARDERGGRPRPAEGERSPAHRGPGTRSHTSAKGRRRRRRSPIAHGSIHRSPARR